MSVTYRVNKKLNNRLFGETINISTETDLRKLVNAAAFLSGLDRTFQDADKKYETGLKSLYDGFLIGDWQSDISTRITELRTIYCYENVSVINVAKGGSVQLEYCDGSKSVRFLDFGETIIKECIVKDSIKPFSDGKKYRIPAILKGIRYVQECGSVTTTTTTFSKG